MIDGAPTVLRYERRWRTPGGNVLHQGLPEPWPVSGIAEVILPDGSRLVQAARFWLESPGGALLQAWPTPRAYSLEDTLYIYDLCTVCDGILGNYMWEQTRDQIPTVRLIRLELEGLVSLD